MWRADQDAVTVGVALLFGAVLYTGVGRDPLWLLGVTLPVVVVWSVGTNAVRLGRQVGRTGETLRVELVQFVSVLVVATVGGGAGYLGFRSLNTTPSVLGVALLFAGVVAAMLALR